MTEGDLARAVAAVNEIVGKASDQDRTVTVEVGVGGGLRSIRITPHAMRYGAKYLAETVVKTAAKATARANEQAHQLYASVLGSKGDRLADQLGLTYDPALTADDPRSRRGFADDDGEDYPESWLR
jgi:YbaB/EbfC DNA-binding family protein